MASAWSKPLKIDATINKALVAQSIAAVTPVGDHSHDDREVSYKNKSRAGSSLRRNYAGGTRGGWPREGGRLQRFLGHIPNWHLARKGRDCYIVVFLPYVRLINWGGPVKPVVGWASGRTDKRGRKWSRVAGSWRMHWADGEPVFRASRKGFTVKGQHFIEKGVAQFAAHGGNAINVEWAKGTDTA